MMNDKEEWNDDFWDEEADDDDNFNEVASDIDANNDETFDNAAEWNEDEHEELIARDSILSHTVRINNHAPQNRAAATNSSRVGNSSNSNINLNNNNNNNNDNNHERIRQRALFAHVIESNNQRAGWTAIADKDLFPALEQRTQRSNNSFNPWQNAPDRLQFQQQQLLQNLLLEQEQSDQKQQQQQQILHDQLLRARTMLDRQSHDQQGSQQNRQIPPTNDMGPHVLRVDELERELLSSSIPRAQIESGTFDPTKKSGWSPFGGKELFTDQKSPNQFQAGVSHSNFILPQQFPRTLTIEQRQQILAHQQQIIQQEQLQLQQMALMKQQQIQQEQQHMSHNPQCFTVEELERQMLGNRSTSSAQAEKSEPKPLQINLITQVTPKTMKTNDTPSSNSTSNRRDSERFKTRDRETRDGREYRNQREYREHRDNRDHRDQRDYRHNRKRLIIIPPQVQLSVIDKAKRSNLFKTMHADEFLQDKMPTSKGFLYRKYATIMKEKPNHDGVLTEKERNWLTKIQEKIQADYDDNFDQDYYYLLYFNRSSASDEAAQKPCGSGVMDRRFIPRERLLYNSNT